MALRKSKYHYIIVESYFPSSTAGLHGPIHVRPVKGQPVPAYLHVECSKDLVNPDEYPVRTKFWIKAKLTDRVGSGEFLYSYFGWPVVVLEKPEKSN